MDKFLAKDKIHTVYPIDEKSFRIDEMGVCNAYLLLGSKEALLIDSGIGLGDIFETVRQITALPIALALTHGHIDHDGGRNFFKEYLIHKSDDKAVYRFLSSRFAAKLLLKAGKIKGAKLSKKPYHAKKKLIDDTKVFDLGDRLIRLLNVPGHTKGSLIFYDEKNKLMITGDDVNPCLWLWLGGCTDVETWLESARKVAEISKGYSLYGGHEAGLITRENLLELISRGEELIGGGKGQKVMLGIMAYPSAERGKIQIWYHKKRIFKRGNKQKHTS